METNSIATEQISNLFAREMDMEITDPDVDLFAKGYLDSLSFVRMLNVLEKAYDVKIDMEDMDFENFQSVRDIATYLNQRKAPVTAEKSG